MWRWSKRAASRVNTLEHSCASSWLALFSTHGEARHLEEGIPSQEGIHIIHKNRCCLLLSLMSLIN